MERLRPSEPARAARRRALVARLKEANHELARVRVLHDFGVHLHPLEALAAARAIRGDPSRSQPCESDTDERAVGTRGSR